MSELRGFRVGLVGWRSRGFVSGLVDAGAVIGGVCELDQERRGRLAELCGTSTERSFARYEDLLQAGIDAVVIGTPMHLHAPQAVVALGAGLHVLSEVTAAVSLEQCRALARAALRAEARGPVYMMAENYCYRRENVLVGELAHQGAFGTPYYADGEYLHDVKHMHHDALGQPTWRHTWQVGRNGCTYGTHSLGPILQWLQAGNGGQSDPVATVACLGSGRHTDPEHTMEDTVVMLCKLASGRLARVRLDMLSNRPHAMTNYALQGTAGAYESARAPGEVDRIWLERGGERRWHALQEFSASLPPWYVAAAERAAAAGHGGADYFVARAFVQACRGEISPPIGLRPALNWTLAGLVSQESISRGGMPLPVPALEDLIEEGPRPDPRSSAPIEGLRLKPQLVMRRPGTLPLDAPPALPPGYRLRLAGPGDAASMAQCLEAAFNSGWDAERVRRLLLEAADVSATYVVTHAQGAQGAQVVATASHREVQDRFPGASYLHFVGTHPGHRGQRLGTAVSIAVIRHGQRAGHRDTVLQTDDHRLPAIATYLALGFTPEYTHPTHAERWSAVFAALMRPPAGKRPGKADGTRPDGQ